MADLAGIVVGTKWQLVSRLGEGTFGDVWLARHRITGRYKALKLLHPSYSSSAEATERFVREAQAASRIDSPHVVGVDDIGHDPDLRRAYLVMELLKGESLYDYLVRAPYHMPFGEAVVVLRQVAAALDAAHAVRIVHRDLKPENIFLSWRSDSSVLVKVLDFGIAKLAGPLATAAPSLEGAGLRRARTVGFVGTVGYASPEQIRDAGSVGVPADIFALGVCSYEMLTGSSYWRSESQEDLVLEICNKNLEAPSRRAPRAVLLPPAYDAWFARVCAHEPGDRFASPHEAIVALEEALAQCDPLPSPRPRTDVPQLVETTGRFREVNASARGSSTPPPLTIPLDSALPRAPGTPGLEFRRPTDSGPTTLPPAEGLDSRPSTIVWSRAMRIAAVAATLAVGITAVVTFRSRTTGARPGVIPVAHAARATSASPNPPTNHAVLDVPRVGATAPQTPHEPTAPGTAPVARAGHDRTGTSGRPHVSGRGVSRSESRPPRGGAPGSPSPAPSAGSPTTSGGAPTPPAPSGPYVGPGL